MTSWQQWMDYIKKLGLPKECMQAKVGSKDPGCLQLDVWTVSALGLLTILIRLSKTLKIQQQRERAELVLNQIITAGVPAKYKALIKTSGSVPIGDGLPMDIQQAEFVMTIQNYQVDINELAIRLPELKQGSTRSLSYMISLFSYVLSCSDHCTYHGCLKCNMITTGKFLIT